MRSKQTCSDVVHSHLPPTKPACDVVTFDKPTAYEILVGYNFPIGIVPKGATGYELDRATGKFHAFLNGTCDFSLEGGYQLKYKSTVSGCISDSKLTKLNGVSVKVLFLWLNIVEVVRDGDTLQFSVGIASANFPIDNFYECLQFGCGLDCDNVTEKCVKGFKRLALEQRCGRLLGFALAGLHDGLKLIKIDAVSSYKVKTESPTREKRQILAWAYNAASRPIAKVSLMPKNGFTLLFYLIFFIFAGTAEH